ncbi:hypothetical protein TSMEX_000050 [Taenia solium]|eukprot:TsM_000255800 transcript=TsM_000255800 gene=TsM_000255800
MWPTWVLVSVPTSHATNLLSRRQLNLYNALSGSMEQSFMSAFGYHVVGATSARTLTWTNFQRNQSHGTDVRHLLNCFMFTDRGGTHDVTNSDLTVILHLGPDLPRE